MTALSLAHPVSTTEPHDSRFVQVCDCQLGLRPEGCRDPHCPVVDEAPESLCSVNGCQRQVEIGSMCESHWERGLDDRGWVRWDGYDESEEW